MPLGSTAFWGCVLPVAKANILSQSPSFERGTSGWGTIQAGTIGTTSQFQQFGAWSGSVAPTSNGTAGARSPTFSAGNGTDYTASIYVRGANGIPYRLAVADSAGVNFVNGGTTTFTGGGTWQRYSVSWTEASGATRTLVITKNSSADTSAFYLDGAMVEAGSITTYIDGDEDGCYWLGEVHASQSARSGTYRGGGSVVALADLGLKPDDTPGIGMPPMEVTGQSYALLPGAEYQRSRATERPFNLTFRPITGTTTQDFHMTRRTIIDAFKPDAVDPQQPIRFWYIGGQGTMTIDAVYASGMELGQMDGPMAEDGALKFVAHDPYWEFTTDQGTALAPRVALGSANFIVKRDPYGRWGTMGQSGTTFQGVSATGGVADLLYTNGTLFVCGSFGTAGGTKAPNIAMYFPDTNAWGSLGPGTVAQAGPLLKMQYSPWGSLYFGGYLGQVNGTAAKTVALWNGGGFGTLTGGSVGTTGASANVQTLLMTGGTLYITGPGLTSFGGTTGTILGYWANGTFGTLTGGSVNGVVSALAAGKDRKLYLGGQFTQAGGTAANRVAVWFGSFGTLGGGMDQSVFALGAAPDARIIAGGLFGTAGAGSANAMAQWNGQQWFPLGSGIVNTTSAVYVLDLFADQRTGDVYANGIFNFAGGLRTPDGAARWNGYAWLPLDIDVAGANAGTFQAIEIAPDRSIFAGGTWAGTAQAAAVAEVVNRGRAEAYPTVKIRSTASSGTARVYQLLNTYPTGDGLWFNSLILQPGEEVVFASGPGGRTLTSSYSGNIFGSIMPGSNIASWRLMPGTNYVSLFCDSDNVAASIYWRARSWSADGGTVV